MLNTYAIKIRRSISSGDTRLAARPGREVRVSGGKILSERDQDGTRGVERRGSKCGDQRRSPRETKGKLAARNGNVVSTVFVIERAIYPTGHRQSVFF